MSKESMYKTLISAGLTPEGACGAMANFKAESNLMANNAQNGMTQLTDAEYTTAVDNGSIDFVYDSVGYGICQWTFWSRKKALLDYAKQVGASIGDEEMQLQFFLNEIKTSYKKVWDVLCTTKSLQEAATIVCTEYERPAINNIDVRIQYAQEFFNEFSQSANDELIKSEEDAINKLISCAKNEVGYLEKNSNYQLDDKYANAGNNNWNKYARDIDKKYPGFYNGKKNGYAYCDIGVDWCFIETFGVNNALKLLCQPMNSAGAGCQYSAQYYRNKGQFFNTPKVGDQIFFGNKGNEYHTGIVSDIAEDTVHTIEWNTSGGIGINANGDGVYEKSYSARSSIISGYGRPNYSIVVGNVLHKDNVVSEGSKGKCVIDGVDYPILAYGDEGEFTKKLQQLLIKKGENCGPDGADGEFGKSTKSAIESFQRKNNLEIDGIVGLMTWTLLLKENIQESPKVEVEEQSEFNMPVLRTDSESIYVKILQIMLNYKGYKDPNGNPLEEDGEFGENTAYAVENIQKDNNLEKDKIVGKQTWKVVLE